MALLSQYQLNRIKRTTKWYRRFCVIIAKPLTELSAESCLHSSVNKVFIDCYLIIIYIYNHTQYLLFYTHIGSEILIKTNLYPSLGS